MTTEQEEIKRLKKEIRMIKSQYRAAKHELRKQYKIDRTALRLRCKKDTLILKEELRALHPSHREQLGFLMHWTMRALNKASNNIKKQQQGDSKQISAPQQDKTTRQQQQQAIQDMLDQFNQAINQMQ